MQKNRMGTDTLFLYNMTIHAIIGVYDEERCTPQPLILDMEMGTDVAYAAKTDQLDATLDYASIAAFAECTLKKKPCQLLETAAEHLAQTLMTHFHLPWIRLRLCKPQALTQTQQVGIDITRSQVCLHRGGRKKRMHDTDTRKHRIKKHSLHSKNRRLSRVVNASTSVKQPYSSHFADG